jgi:hypothetical protein
MPNLIDKKDEIFDTQQKTITDAADINKTEWGLDTEWLTTVVLVLRTVWRMAYDKYKPKETRNPLITFEKNEARKNYEPVLKQLIAILQNSPKVTDDDRKAIGIYKAPPTHHILPPPTSFVDFEIGTAAIRRLVIAFHDAGSTHHGKPHGVIEAEIKWAVLEQPPTSVDELIHSDTDSASPYTIEFDEKQRGKNVYIAMRWVNHAGKGPMSEFKHAIIP